MCEFFHTFRRMCQMTVKSELQTLFRCFLVNSQLLQIAAINSAHCVNEAGMFCRVMKLCGTWIQ
jgi:hypothetical protein